MTTPLDQFRERAKRLADDLTTASICLDVAWYANDCKEFRDAIDDTYANHVYSLIFHSLIGRAVGALLRCIDTQKGAATVQTFLGDLRDPAIWSTLVDDATTRPSSKGDRAVAEKNLNRLSNFVKLDYFLVSRHRNDLNRYRNRELSHSSLAIKRWSITYNEITECIRLGESIAFNARLIAEGTHADPRATRDVYRRYARRFFRAVALGIENGSDRDDLGSWGLSPSICDDV